MTQLHEALLSSTMLTPPGVIFVVNDAGGSGKSTTFLAIADHAQLSDIPLQGVQVDDQGRLPAILGGVISIKSDPAAVRLDRLHEQRIFVPLHGAVSVSASEGGYTVCEVGANQAERVAYFLKTAEFQEDLAALKMSSMIIAPHLSTTESIRLGARAANSLLSALPEAHLVILGNERDGRVDDLHPGSQTRRLYEEVMRPLLARGTSIRLPNVPSESWGLFEAAGVRPVDAVRMSVEDVMSITGLPRPMAKIVRGDVAAWLSVIFAQLERVIDFDSHVRR